jgi:peptidyl-prolyl cis-trans isomerase C
MLAACSRAPAAQAPPEPGDVAVAKVGGAPVWLSDVRREAVAEGSVAEGDPFSVKSPQFDQALASVIDERLLAREAVREKLDRDPAARARLNAAREKVLSDLEVENSVDKAVSDDAIRTLYAEQQRLAQRSEEMRGRQIVSASEADALAAKKLIASGQPFDTVAMTRSTDAATRFNGGDLGPFTLDALPEPYATALKNAQPGQVVGPFKAQDGWVLVKLEDRRPEAPVALDQARPVIVRFLTYDEIRKLLERLRGGTKIEELVKPGAAPTPQEPASAPPKTLQAHRS